MFAWRTRLASLARTSTKVLGIVGQSKSFVANPILGSRRLNRAGLHAARVVLAHAVTGMRRKRLEALVSSEERAAFTRDGFLVIPDFLPAKTFDALVESTAVLPRTADQLQIELRQNQQGDTLTQRLLISVEVEREVAALTALTNNLRFRRLISYCGASKRRPLNYLQGVINGVVDGPTDPQKSLHADTFHSTLKAWFFLDEVDEGSGPFTYVPGSHNLTLERLLWEYRRSVNFASRADGYSEKGSPRIREEELPCLGLEPPRPIVAGPNTLVIADTFGFHRRGDARCGARRREIWSYNRRNPFSPLLGFGSSIGSKVEQIIATEYWRYQDRLAASRGWRSSWHRIASHRFLAANP